MAHFGIRLRTLLHLLVSLPLHLLCIPKRTLSVPDLPAATAPREVQVLPAQHHKVAFFLLALILALQGAISWGLSVRLIDLYLALGMGKSAALTLSSLYGPAQIFSRALEYATGNRVSIERVALIALVLVPLTFIILLLFGSTIIGGAAFVLLYGIANGSMSMVKSTLPLSLFGRASYATRLGRLYTVQHISYSISPAAVAAVFQNYGARAAIVAAFLCVTISLLGMISLYHRAAAARL